MRVGWRQFRNRPTGQKENTMKKYLVLALLTVSTAYAAERVATVYKISRMSSTEVGISCNNGADPTGTKVGNTVVMSCGK